MGIIKAGEANKNGSTEGLTPYLSPLGAWAFAIGTSIGWGSFVITSNTYLSQAGPLGSTLGMLIGMAIMLVIARNYHFMMNRHPDAGGVYSYTKHTFGIDYGFMIAWILSLTYIAIFWANATSLPLFSRYFFGSTFEFGRMYSLFGYDVYFGEVLLTAAAIAIVALICTNSKHGVARCMIAMALLFTICITACFVVSYFKIDVGFRGFDPLMLPDKDAFSQVLRIACISPWAFIGFENISQSTEEFTFAPSKAFRILTIAVISTTMLYIFVTVLSVTAYPAEYDSWLAYISDLGNIQGLKGLPAFYAAEHYLGSTGVLLLTLSLLSLIITSLFGNLVALSRLIYALAKDSVLPAKLGELNAKAIPYKAILAIGGVSLLVPFLGRTAIGWIVDVTTIGATIVYGFVSAATFKAARQTNHTAEIATGLLGAVIMVLFGLMILLPSLMDSNAMATESYILFSTWAVLGFAFFRVVLQHDPKLRFGKSVIVWIALLSLILFTSMAWMSQADQATTDQAIGTIQQYYNGEADQTANDVGEEEFLAQQNEQIRSAKTNHIIVIIALFGIAFGIMLSNLSYLNRRNMESERKLSAAQTAATTDALTGIKNKRAYAEWEQNLNNQIHEGTLEELSIVVCDVNGLKHINDTLGHKAGDDYIRAACSFICNRFKHSPVFRIGGDEFVVILRRDDHDHRHDILESFNQQIEKNVETGNVVISAGMSDFDPAQDHTVRNVFDRADVLLYERKRQLKELGAITRE